MLKVDSKHKEIVEAAGADYISEADYGYGPFVLIGSRETRSSFGVYVKELTTETVYAKLVESNRLFGKSTPELTHASRGTADKIHGSGENRI